MPNLELSPDNGQSELPPSTGNSECIRLAYRRRSVRVLNVSDRYAYYSLYKSFVGIIP